MKKEEETLIIEPFEGCNFKVKVEIPKNIKGNELRPFPHNMQTDNMHLLQEENYHLFEGEYLKPAVYLKDVGFIKFDHLLYDIPFFKMGEKLVNIGYKIMLCNPDFTKEQLFDCLYDIFIHFCHIPETRKLRQSVRKLGSSTTAKRSFITKLVEGNKAFTEQNRKRIEIGVEQIMNKPFKGSIMKQPKVIFNPDYYLTEEEKREISNELVGTNKSENTLEEIYSTLLNWDSDKKPTQVNIAKKLGVSERTVRTYWKDAKEKLVLAI